MFSVPSSNGDGHSGCVRGEPCPDNHLGFFPFGDDELPVEVGDFMNVAQELFPENQSSEFESSDFSNSVLSRGSGDNHFFSFETNDEVAVVEDLYRPE